jgi:probable HAF family extracellular repeat protein
MNRFALVCSLALLLCASALAQSPTSYTFKTVNYPHDTFTQLLGINNSGKIAGYHNVNINSGFTLVLPHQFTTENFPGAAQTQVIGINNKKKTDGFYVDNGGITHGFLDANGAFFTVDFPGSAFNQLLSLNDHGQAAGYYSQSVDNSTPDFPYIYNEYGGIFEVITIPQAVNGAQATGINNSGHICGFYVDSAMVNHGWLLIDGIFSTLDVPDATFTQALGINNKGQVVGVFMDGAGLSHGFVYEIGKTYHIIDDPNGIGATVANGINDKGQIVGFYGTSPLNSGFVATP